MEAILTTFGIDWRLLLINMVNFGLLVAALWYFLYGPIMRVLEERRGKVTAGLKAADMAQAKLEEIELSREGVLAGASREADQLLQEARASAAAKEQELVMRAEAAAKLAVNEAHAQAAELKAKALEESKREVAKLIVLGIEKVHSTSSGQVK